MGIRHWQGILFAGLWLGIAVTTPTRVVADDAVPGIKWHPGHYAYLGADPGPIGEKHLLHPNFRGLQKSYLWNKIEIAAGEYDFSEVDADLEFLSRHGMYLVFQVQYKSFSAGKTAVPAYIIEQEDFGPDRTYLSHSKSIYPSFWNPKVAARFHQFLRELGKRYDSHPNLELVNLPESAPSPGQRGELRGRDFLGSVGYTEENYLQAIKGNMRVLSEAFPKTVKLQYVNFGPPGACEAWAEYGKQIGVGVGGPDLHPGRPIPGYPIWNEASGQIPVGAAVQYANYFNTAKEPSSGLIDVRENFAFARELGLNYIFWGTAPESGFQRVVQFLDSPDFPQGVAGGLDANLPARLKERVGL